jgi:hypothetical protein
LPDDGLIRIGYAGGSRTHQRDFALCVAAVAGILRAYSECRLVIFRSEQYGALVNVDEFPALAELGDQIEWRELVPHAQLPFELARFDINLAPLEVDNPFCEAKSELKFFEAALVDVPTIASPTGPFRRAVRHGETGLLAFTESEWREAMERLIGDPALRRDMGRNARRDVLWRFGPEHATQSMELLIDLLKGGRAGARAFETRVRRAQSVPVAPPLLPEHDIVYLNDQLRVAEVTVIMPVYNYEDYVREALDSVAAQTLADLDLIIADDRSTDASISVVLD